MVERRMRQIGITIVIVLFFFAMVFAGCNSENRTETITRTSPVTTTITAPGTQTSTISSTETITTTSTQTSTISLTETITTTSTQTSTISLTETITGTTSQTTTTSKTTEPETSIFPDDSLEIAVRNALGKQSEEILLSDLASLTVLSASSRGIKDLSGIELCTNLIDLDLSNNQITDIYPISSLINLTVLNLDTNWIVDISAISELTNLSCWIVDISAISELTNLSWLDLQGNDIGDIWPLVYNAGLGEGDRLFLPQGLIVVEHTGPWDVLNELEDRGVLLNVQYNW
jgi:Leucine-rich repeat (LRR) protein